jgi:hypothetical protein
MKVKIYTALVALVLAVPAVSMAVSDQVIDQFGGGVLDQFSMISGGIAQGMYTGEDFTADSIDDVKSAQGGNVIVGDVNAPSLQAAMVDEDVKLFMVDGVDNTQGLNVIQGKAGPLTLQVGLVDGDTKLKSVDNVRAAQGVNVVDACNSCQ